jgi:2-polyprenyl-6-hydroxyphenyl methylase/3-demethylubiquinone-9 3-methyltransferase
MAKAIAHAASLVSPGGHFVLAIYNSHWSSQAWLAIKWSYVRSPRWLQRLFVAALFPIIYMAKWIVTGENPKKQERGMDFFYDVVDWVGGYPYEYASIDQMRGLVEALGFETVKVCPSRVPTGCNEFVFRRKNFIESI